MGNPAPTPFPGPRPDVTRALQTSTRRYLSGPAGEQRPAPSPSRGIAPVDINRGQVHDRGHGAPSPPDEAGTALTSDLVVDALRDVLARLDHYDMLNRRAGIDSDDRSVIDRLHHLARLLNMLKLCSRRGLPIHNVLIAIAAQAIEWAIVVDRVERTP